MRAQILSAARAAVLSLALGVSGAYAGATSNEGGPAGGGSPSSAQTTPNAIPAAPNAQSGGAGAEGKSATEPSGGSPQTGERSDEKSDKAAKGAEKPEGDRGGKSAEDNKHDQSGDRRGQEAADTKDQVEGKSTGGQGKDEKSSNRENKDGSTGESRDKKEGDRKRAHFEPRDKEKVRTYFSEHKPNVKRVDRDRVSVSIGVAIPGGIALYPLPAGVVVVADCPLQYFLWGDDLVIVDSCSREVVDIVPNMG
jgi:Protein of unknown function (DUF1236)